MSDDMRREEKRKEWEEEEAQRVALDEGPIHYENVRFGGKRCAFKSFRRVFAEIFSLSQKRIDDVGFQFDRRCAFASNNKCARSVNTFSCPQTPVTFLNTPL